MKIHLPSLLFLILSQVLVGMNIAFTKLIVADIPTLLILTVRFALASLILLPLHWLTNARIYSLTDYFSQLTRRDWIYIIAQSLTAGFLFNLFMLLGLHYTDANVAGIITSALPAIIVLMSWLLLRESISGKKMLCILLATIGLIVIASEKAQNLSAAHSFFGDSLILLSMLPEATYYILCKVYKNRLPVFLASSLLNGISCLLFLLFISLNGNYGAISLASWGILFILGLGSGLFYVLWFYGCQRIDNVLASLTTATMPIAAVIFAWILLGERLSLAQSAGMALVILSIGVYAKR